MFQLFPLILWLLILEFLSLITFPIVFFILKNLPDKGYPFSKSISILFSTYITWIIVNLTPIEYSTSVILTSISIVIFLSFFSFISKKKNIIDFLKQNKKLILITELLFLSSFLIFVLIRYFDNSIVDAEKPQDFMILNGLLRTKTFPLNDPWFTGKPIQYYYFGHMMIANLIKLSDIDSGVAYNLAIPLFFSLTLINAFSLIYNLTGKTKYGVIASVLVGLVGNFQAFLQFIENWKLIPMNYWLSAHFIIPGTINEFPFFSFLHADMHAHMMAIPFSIAFLGIIYNIFKTKDLKLNSNSILEILFLSLFVGAFAFINTWDYPSYLGLSLIFIAINKYIRGRRIDPFLIKDISFLSFFVIIFSFLLFLPFHLSVPSVKSIDFTTQKTGVIHYIIIYGLFFFVSYSYLYLDSKKKNVLNFIKIGKHFPIIDIFYLLLLILGLLNQGVIILFLTFTLGLFILLKRLNEKKIEYELVFSLVIFIFGLSLLIGIEFVFIDDAFIGELERVNTVFKFGMQIWILISVSAAYFLYYLESNCLESKSKILWTVLFIILLASTLIYPIFATYTKTKNNFEYFGKHSTLNGKEYLKTQSFCDFDAVEWINENIQGTPVILESKGQSFTWTSCVSFNTGLPTLIGWEGHEQQWRPNNLDYIAERVNDVNEIYTNANQDLISKYNISYIYVGSLEKEKYPEESLNRFDGLFDLVYNNSETKIYKVK